MVSASPTAMSMAFCPSIETLIRPVPVVPISRAGTPNALRAVEQRAELARVGPRQQPAKPTPKTASRPMSSASEHRPSADRRSIRYRRCRTRTQRASPRGRLPRNRAPIEATLPVRRHQQLLQRLLAIQIHVGRHAGDEAVHRLQVLAAAKLVTGLAKQHNRVAAAFEAAAEHLCSNPRSAPRPQEPGSDKSRSRRSRCRG